MEPKKEGIAEDIQYRQETLRLLRSRLQDCEVQIARQGINTPPTARAEVEYLIELIRQQEDELSELARIVSKYVIVIKMCKNFQSNENSIRKSNCV